MNDLETNARRMVLLFEQMQVSRPGPAMAQLKDLNLSFSHLRALRLLFPDQVRSMKELAEQLQFTPPSVTALTRRLVQTGLVQRAGHTGDSRVVLLSLTDAGREFFQQLAQERIDSMVHLLQGLSASEQEQFLELLARAVQAMQTTGPRVEASTT